MAEGGTTDCRTWQQKALEEQQLYYEMLGDRDWDSYQQTEIEFLERNVGHAMFGPPEELPDENQNGNTGYSKKKLEQIRKVCAAIQENSRFPTMSKDSRILVAVVFVCLEVKEGCLAVPVFRIPSYEPDRHSYLKNRETYNSYFLKKHIRLLKAEPKSQPQHSFVRTVKTTMEKKLNCKFVDTNCRVYKDWLDYLRNNQLPKCSYCYPTNGVYLGDANDNVVLEFGKTPASKIGNQICSVLDTASTVVMVGGAAVTAAAMFATVAAPLMVATTAGAVTTGVYSAGRSVAHLVDRGKHKQSVGLQEAESRNCWLSVAGSMFSFASGHATRLLAKMVSNGEVVSRAGCILVNVLNVGSLTVNGLGMLNSLLVLREKAQTGDLRPLDVFQFASSLLFFTMSAVNMKTANSIIKETQDGAINNFEASLRSNRHRRMFRRLMKETQGQDGNSMLGKARVIRGITRISNKDDFFAGLVRVQKQFSESGAKVVLTDTGLVEINGQLRLHPMKFWEIDKIQRDVILDATRNLNQGLCTQEQFNSEMQAICKELNLVYEPQRFETLSNINQVIASDETLQGKSFLSQLQLNHVDMLSYQLHRFAKEHRRQLLSIAVNLAELTGSKKTAEFLRIVGFVANYVEQVAGEVEGKYQADLATAQNMYGDRFNRETFDYEYHIQGNRRDHFIRTILTNYNSYEALKYLVNAYKRLRTPESREKPKDALPGSSSSATEANIEASALTKSVARFSKEHHERILSIAVNLADILGFRSTPQLIRVTDFVVKVIEKLMLEIEARYEDNLQRSNCSKEEFDKKYMIEGDRRDHFVRNVLANYEYYEQLKNLKIAFEAENNQESVAGPSYSQENKDVHPGEHTEAMDDDDDVVMHVDKKEDETVLSDFKTDLSDQEVYNLASEVTGLCLFEGNSMLSRDGYLSFITITDPHLEPITVMINSKTPQNTINAQIIV